MSTDLVKKRPNNVLGPGPGRPKGVPNKVTTELKTMILEALDKAGGVKYLVAQAESNPASFMTLIGKVIPLQVSGDPNSPIKHSVKVEFVGTHPVS